jgi:HTH-type transcriptional regulator, glycine betaine synthesis regulator
MPSSAKPSLQLAESVTLIRADGRAPDVVAFEAGLIDFFMQAAEMLGAPRSLAAIYGMIFASAEPLCFADVEARLDISKGSVSQGLRVLREIGAIKLAPKTDDRREYFVPDLALRKLVLRFLDERLKKQLAEGTDRLNRLDRSLPKLNAESTDTLEERLQQLKNWHEKTRAVLPVVKTFLALTKP